MTKIQPDYLAYLVRLWRVNDEERTTTPPIWRVAIENPHTGEQRGFAGLEDLFDFLREQVGLKAKLEERD